VSLAEGEEARAARAVVGRRGHGLLPGSGMAQASS
jgi:hypothetical protein